MADPTPPTASPRSAPGALRRPPSLAARALAGSACLGVIFLVWWWATRGAAEERLISPATLGSPSEVFGSFKSLWFDRALTRHTAASVWRVMQGFGLAVLIGVPLGILAGCFPLLGAFLAPLNLFGRNVPVAALIPLTMLWFGIDELQKVMFIFIASVAFVLSDAMQNVINVEQKYVDTAYTLGASRRQVIFKVLLPMALPDIFNSLRLLFGVGFGYIILAEVVNMDRGLGTLITVSERRGPREHVYLCLIVITLVAYAIDRLIYRLGFLLFPHRRRSS
ncbi:MAG: ABC transporter permease [Deltaproteobacteria bacterium]|nr:ABC transporter permease [Deltaproteobacteria bacterium]